MQEKAEKRWEWTRVCVLGCALFLLLALPRDTSTQSGSGEINRKKTLLVGTWQKREITYLFEDEVTLSVTRLGGGPSGYIRSRYTWAALGMHDCFTFRKDPADSLSQQVVLVGEVADSTAVLALGTPFVRSGTGSGLTGTWNHVEHLIRIEWTIGQDTVEYRKMVFNADAGRETVVEEYRGTWRRAEGRYEPGSFTVNFPENGQAIVLPMVYRDLMYLFDLSPGKSLFTRGKGKPDERLTKNSRRT